MRKMKKGAAVLLLAAVATLCAPAAFADGGVGSPGVALDGGVGSPGIVVDALTLLINYLA